MIEKAIYSRLSGSSAITNLVSTRIYSLERPDVSSLPAIIFSRVSTERDTIAHSGALGVAQAMVQVSIYSENLLDGLTIGEEVRKLFHCTKGTWGTIVVQFSKVINELHLYEPQDEIKNLVFDLMLTYSEDII